MRLKLILLILLLVINYCSMAQYRDSYGSATGRPIIHKENINVELIAWTRYSTFLIGTSVGTEVHDDVYPFYIPVKLGYWKSTFNQDYYLNLQLGVFIERKKVNIGSNFINYQKKYPYDMNKNIKANIPEYNNPLNLIVVLKGKPIFREGFFSNTRIYMEYDHYHWLHSNEFRITFSQNLLGEK